MAVIDVTIPLNSRIPTWPGSAGFRIRWAKRLKNGDDCNNSVFETDSHVATHIDAPYHFIENGETVDEISLDTLVGPCLVIDLPGVQKVSASELSAADIDASVSRLLIRTDNSRLWTNGQTAFTKNYAALTADAADWLVSREIKLVGIDYLSIGGYADGVRTHQILLNAGIVAVEGLNLWKVAPGMYELICLPIKVQGAEGAPARVILRND